MEKLVKLEGKEIGFKCSAGTVRAYRMNYGRDLILDMASLEKELIEDKTLSKDSTQCAEEVAYTMAREYDSALAPIGEWLDQFSPYFVYAAVPEIICMWADNLKTINSTKKNSEKLNEKPQQPCSS